MTKETPQTPNMTLMDKAYVTSSNAMFRTMAFVGAVAALPSALAGNPPANGGGGGGNQSIIDTQDLNDSLRESLTTGRDEGANLVCTGIMVFLDNRFVSFVFGLILLIAIGGLAYAWYQNSRGGGGFSRIFFIIVGGMAVVALIGTLAQNFMQCNEDGNGRRRVMQQQPVPIVRTIETPTPAFAMKQV